MNTVGKSTLIIVLIFLLTNCNNINNRDKLSSDKISVIFDTDANNELDDQHALAYLLFNGNTFDLKGVTVNATYNGGDIDKQYDEALRVSKLCSMPENIPLFRGANGSFDEIKLNINESNFDGSDAVDFIITQAKLHNTNKLNIIAVGKLTNIALAVKKDPLITNNIRLVWLGSNYPDPGEYNLVNDIPAMNSLLQSNISFEMVTVRYGESSGTDAVRITKDEVTKKVAGLGPQIKIPVIGRHGGTFSNFGDYSVSLFEYIEYDDDTQSRALYDMAAVAIMKNSNWASMVEIPSPIMINEEWVEQPENSRRIVLWENFNSDKIMSDFYNTLEHYNIVK